MDADVSDFSIKEMAENIRFAIEKEEKVQDEILLKDKDFVVDLVRALYSFPKNSDVKRIFNKSTRFFHGLHSYRS